MEIVGSQQLRLLLAGVAGENALLPLLSGEKSRLQPSGEVSLRVDRRVDDESVRGERKRRFGAGEDGGERERGEVEGDAGDDATLEEEEGGGVAGESGGGCGESERVELGEIVEIGEVECDFLRGVLVVLRVVIDIRIGFMIGFIMNTLIGFIMNSLIGSLRHIDETTVGKTRQTGIEGGRGATTLRRGHGNV